MLLGLYSLLTCLEKSVHFAADLKAYSQLLRLKIGALIEAMQTRKEDNVIILRKIPSSLHQSICFLCFYQIIWRMGSIYTLDQLYALLLDMIYYIRLNFYGI